MSTVVITGARAPVALHLGRLFREIGAKVVLADTFRFPMGRAMRSAAYERLPPARRDLDAYARDWQRILNKHEPRIVLATCEEVFHLAAARDLVGVAIPLFAPSLTVLRDAHDKWTFSQNAGGLGADPPKTQKIVNQRDVQSLGDTSDLVLKPVWSRFGSRTLISPDDVALRRVRPTTEDPWIVQERMRGEEICATAVSVSGIVTALQAYRPMWRAGLGAGVAFAAAADHVVGSFVKEFCKKTAWNGMISFDFKRDDAGAVRVLECNPRPTSGIHFFGRLDELPNAIFGKSSVATGEKAMSLPIAMATYGLAQALRERRLFEWASDRRSTVDIAFWPGEGSAFGTQLLAAAEIACIALRSNKSLKAASTKDIEWNGEPFQRAFDLKRSLPFC